MHFLKLIFYIIASSCLLLADYSKHEEIIAIVNTHAITSNELQQEIIFRQHYMSDSSNKIDLIYQKQKSLQALVEKYLIIDKAKDLNITISEYEFNKYIDQIKKDNNLTSNNELESAVKLAMGINLDIYLQNLKFEIIRNKLLQQEVVELNAEISNQKLLDYYTSHIDNYRQPKQYHVRELVLLKNNTIDDSLKNIQKELKNQIPFENLVAIYSVAPSNTSGGDLGWLTIDALHVKLGTALINLNINNITPPIEIGNNIYILQLIETKMGIIKPFDEVKNSILIELKEMNSHNLIKKYLESLRIKALIHYL